MSGNYSRNKGLRNEYLVRDALRAAGFTSNRVPSSGAAEGFKGDVTYEGHGRQGLIEVKSRKCAWKRVYDLYGWVATAGKMAFTYSTPEHLHCVVVADTLLGVLEHDGVFSPLPASLTDKGAKLLVKSKALLGQADVLAIRDDHQKFLYVKYR